MALSVYPVILCNTGTGSDSAASGAGPATALTGAGCAVTNTSSSVTISDVVDLSGVAQDGSAVLYVVTASGRRFTRINTVSGSSGAWTLVVDDSTWTTGTTLSWAIGGKRATWDDAQTRKLFTADAKGGWTVRTETDQPITSSIAATAAGASTTGMIFLEGDSTSTQRVVNQSTNTSNFNGSFNGWLLRNLKITNSAGSKTNAVGISCDAAYTTAGASTILENVALGDPTNKLLHAIARPGSANVNLKMVSCEVAYCTDYGMDTGSGGTGNLILYDCWVHNNTSCGLQVIFCGAGQLPIIGCVFSGNGSHGVFVPNSGSSQNGTLFFLGNTFHNNTGDDIRISSPIQMWGATILNNNITKATVNGINYTSTLGDTLKHKIDYNNYGSAGSSTSNGTAAVVGFTRGAGSLDVDPGYVNAAGNNYAVGTNVKALGYPQTSRTIGGNTSATTTYVDIGAAQRQEAGGTYTAAANVRNGTDRGDGTLGTLVVPAAATVLSTATFDNGTAGTYVGPATTDVKTSVTYGAASALTGTYDGSDRWTDPGVANVLLTVAYKANSTTNNRTGTVTLPIVGDVEGGVTFGASLGSTGTFTVPALGDVRNLTGYGAGGTEFTGSLVVSGATYSDPGIANVKTGVTYTYSSSSLTGTYDGSDRWTDPGIANVLASTAYKANSTSNNRTGTATVPTAAQVLIAVTGYGAGGTALAGTVTLPATTDVKNTVTYGASLGLTGSYGGGATGDWTTAELAQIRYRLGIDGTQTAPTTTSAELINGAPFSLSDGTAQGGSTTSITLAAGSSSVADFYKGYRISGIVGAGLGQFAFVTAYNGTTKVATLDRTLGTAFDSTTTYALDAPVSADVVQWLGSTPNALISGRVDASAGVVADKAGYALTGAYDASKTAAQAGNAMTLVSAERDSVAGALLDLANGVESGETLRQNLRLVRAILTGLSTDSGASFVAKRKDGITTAVTITHDSSGDRSAVVVGNLT